MESKGMALYTGATVITMDGEKIAGAVLVRDGYVIAVGDEQTLAAQADADVACVDCGGGALLPAFIDAHSHFIAVAQNLLQVDACGVTDFDALGTRIKAYIGAREPSPGKMIVCQGFDPELTGGWPSLARLDAFAPGYPLVLTHSSGHMGMLNTMALERLGFGEDTPDPTGGRIGRTDGHLNGYLEESAFLQAEHGFPQPGMQELLEAAKQAQARYAAYGIALMQEGLMMRSMLPMYKALLDSGILRLDVVGYPAPEDFEAFACAFPASVSGFDRHFHLGGMKIILDGSPQARTAYLNEPYEGAQDGYRGYPAMTLRETTDAVMKASRRGVRLLAHCNGDAAAQQLIDACRIAAARGAKLSRVRPVMIHAQMLTPRQMDELKALYITPSFFVAHVLHWGDVHLRNLGERAQGISALASAKARGLRFTLHQDAPVIRPDMLQTIQIACTRRTRKGIVLGEQERVSAYAALEGVTVNAALQAGLEDRGRIAPGMRADFILLDKSPLDVPPEEIGAIRVLRTIVRGEEVFSRD